ncbi:MAG: hypothetical protein KJO36_06095 [Acidimicrobiia bacterium]|nr:hypothetical protein [Acidimicrobiia bacterium]
MIFVNDKHGSDDNYGTTIEHPVKTLTRAVQIAAASDDERLICVTTILKMGGPTAGEMIDAAEAKGKNFQLDDWLGV